MGEGEIFLEEVFPFPHTPNPFQELPKEELYYIKGLLLFATKCDIL
jgi:hypothetical protein